MSLFTWERLIKDPFGGMFWGKVNHLIHLCTVQGAAMGDAESQVIVGRMALEGLKVVSRYVSLDIIQTNPCLCKNIGSELEMKSRPAFQFSRI